MNAESGLYDRRAHPSKRTVTVKVTGSGGVASLETREMFCCEREGCHKMFKTKGALATHVGWHARQGTRFSAGAEV